MNKYLNKIIQGDCLEIMKEMPDKCVDLVLTDPPYGIGADKGVGGFGSSPDKAKKYKDDWDGFVPTKDYFDEILRVGKNVIIFGGNFFTDKLPVNGHWIVWDKVGGVNFQNPFSDCELAWTSMSKKTVKKYTLKQQGFISDTLDIRIHPTQKPTELFSKIIKDYTENGDLVLDPFLGSGTTAVACKLNERDFIGVEIDEEYCNKSRERLNNIQKELF